MGREVRFPAPFCGPSVHPHGCGACWVTNGPDLLVIGSSPRVWGVPEFWRTVALLVRFIPTGVGRAIGSRSLRCVTAVHPHGCGACRMSNQLPCSLNGSSPRVWGVQPHWAAHGQKLRFIPTGVGRAARVTRPGLPGPVHPHGCGACLPPDSSTMPVIGSSPRVWGVLADLPLQEHLSRFIPTGVGRASTS